MSDIDFYPNDGNLWPCGCIVGDPMCHCGAPDAEAVRDWAEDFVESWAEKFPASRFFGRTVEEARMSVGPQEVVDLVAAALDAYPTTRRPETARGQS